MGALSGASIMPRKPNLSDIIFADFASLFEKSLRSLNSIKKNSIEKYESDTSDYVHSIEYIIISFQYWIRYDRDDEFPFDCERKFVRYIYRQLEIVNFISVDNQKEKLSSRAFFHLIWNKMKINFCDCNADYDH